MVVAGRAVGLVWDLRNVVVLPEVLAGVVMVVVVLEVLLQTEVGIVIDLLLGPMRLLELRMMVAAVVCVVLRLDMYKAARAELPTVPAVVLWADPFFQRLRGGSICVSMRGFKEVRVKLLVSLSCFPRGMQKHMPVATSSFNAFN